jgi:hypothetical protein
VWAVPKPETCIRWDKGLGFDSCLLHLSITNLQQCVAVIRAQGKAIDLLEVGDDGNSLLREGRLAFERMQHYPLHQIAQRKVEILGKTLQHLQEAPLDSDTGLYALHRFHDISLVPALQICIRRYNNTNVSTSVRRVMQFETLGTHGCGAEGELMNLVSVVGTIHIPQRGHEAFALFTPRGERGWAHDWEPQFPVSVDDDSEPGTVFHVVHGSARSVWIVCRRDDERLIQYARLIPGKNAGTVTVTLEEHGSGSLVAVEYRLTPLTSQADSELTAFVAHYPAFLQEWERSISAILA